jgi:outer membrane protein assembly factor BamB/enterochelin esterase-like enzyme
LNEFGLEVAWKKKLGSGYSGVTIANGLGVTMFEAGDLNIVVVAFDTETGEERWRFEIGPRHQGLNGSYNGPISTPLIVGNIVVALDPWGRLVGLDVLAGELVWSIDLPEELESKRPLYGYGTSPILFDGTVIVQIGAPEAAVAGFDPETGKRLWTVGTDVMEYQTPVPLIANGRRQALATGQKKLMAIDPATGALLWEYAHGGGGIIGAASMVPVAAGSDKLFLANKGHSSTLVELSQEENGVVGSEKWEERTIRNSYTVPLYHEGYIYGFSSRFLTCVDAATGKAVWKSRPPGDGFLILVDDHLVILTKNGSLHVVKATPEGYEEVASLQLFKDLAWTPPSFADGHIYVRSLGEVARVDIRPITILAEADTAPEDVAVDVLGGGRFEQFLIDVGKTEDKKAVVDRFLDSIEQFPFIEGENRVHFLYRGPGEDLAIGGDMIGSRQESPMARVEGTDLFFYSTELEPDARVNYLFIRDFKEITDTRNPRSTTTGIYGPDMEFTGNDDNLMPMSWVAMPRWQAPAHLAEPPVDARRGRIVTHELESKVYEEPHTIQVYLPAGYGETDTRYPVAYYHGGRGALTRGDVPTSLDNLLGKGVDPLIAVFIERASEFFPTKYVDMWADELVPFIDGNYRTIATPEGRANIGGGFTGFHALYLTIKRPDIAAKVAGQSVAFLDFQLAPLEELVHTATEQPLDIYIEWGSYDMQNPQEAWDIRDADRKLVEFLTSRGYSVAGGEVHDGTGWSSWRNRTDRVLESLFPPARD